MPVSENTDKEMHTIQARPSVFRAEEKFAFMELSFLQLLWWVLRRRLARLEINSEWAIAVDQRLCKYYVRCWGESKDFFLECYLFVGLLGVMKGDFGQKFIGLTDFIKIASIYWQPSSPRNCSRSGWFFCYLTDKLHSNGNSRQLLLFLMGILENSSVKKRLFNSKKLANSLWMTYRMRALWACRPRVNQMVFLSDHFLNEPG